MGYRNPIAPYEQIILNVHKTIKARSCRGCLRAVAQGRRHQPDPRKNGDAPASARLDIASWIVIVPPPHGVRYSGNREGVVMDPVAVRGSRACLGPVAAAVALHVLFLGIFLHLHHNEISSLVCAPDGDLKRPGMEAIRVSFGAGYDGSAYYRIAQHPLQRQSSEPVRHLRIVYPLLSWAFSGGDPYALLWLMPAVNLLAVAGLVLLGSNFAIRYGHSPWWGFLLPLALNAVLPALRDL